MTPTQAPQNKSVKKNTSAGTTTGTTATTNPPQLQKKQQSAVVKKKTAPRNPQYKRNFKNDGGDGDDDDDERYKSSGGSGEEEEDDNQDDGGNDGGGENDASESIENATLLQPKTKKKYKTSPAFDEVEYAKLLAELFPSTYSKQKATTLESKKRTLTPSLLSSSSSLSSKQNQNDRNEKRKKMDSGNEITMTPHLKEGGGCARGGGGGDTLETSTSVKSSSSSVASNSNVVGGNYNIVINIKEPFDTLEEEDDYTSDMDDSVYDDDSASSNESSDDSDETYDDDDNTSDEDDDDDSDTEKNSDDDDDDEDGNNDNSEKGEDSVKDGYEKCNLKIRGEPVVVVSANSKVSDKNKKQLKKEEKNECDDDSSWNSDDETTIQAIKKIMEDMLAVDKNNKVAMTTLAQMIEKEKKIKDARKERNRKIMRKNVRKFGRLLHKKNSANDLKYFKKHLSNEQQVGVLSELEELNKMMLVEKPYRLTLLESKIPKQYKAIALKRIQNLRYMDPGAGEYYKVKNWVDTFMTIPFGVYKTLPITMEVGVERCHDFMESAKDLLDSAVYGLNDAKMQIMQMVGQWISNPSAMGSAIAIKGPPGTGKTTLVKEGISKILGRDFAFIALGGATDSSFLEGHSYTYEGSTWGKVVDILIRCKSMNPVIFFDELDKLSDTPKGEEIAGILTHLTDTSQNTLFHDKYFSEINFDLSKCLFIFSYNDETRVNPILLDRMYRIHTNGYTKKDKTQIAQKYLIPKIQTEVAFKPDQIIIPNETIEYIVEHHTNKEDGVRNLKRCLEIIYTKLNLYRLMKPGTKLFDKDATSIEVSFPFTVTNNIVDIMIKKTESTYPTFMYN